MKRFAIYTIDEIFDVMRVRARGQMSMHPDARKFKVKSDRLQMFLLKGTDCVTCNIKGAFFALEGHGETRPHLNLYAINAAGHEVLMTKDHILAKANGGKNEMANYQPMCVKCNGAKGCKLAA